VPLFFSSLLLRLIGIPWGLPTKTLSLTTYHPDEAFIFQAFEHRVKSHTLHSGVIALNYGTFFYYLSAAFVGLAKILGIVVFVTRER